MALLKRAIGDLARAVFETSFADRLAAQHVGGAFDAKRTRLKRNDDHVRIGHDIAIQIESNGYAELRKIERAAFAQLAVRAAMPCALSRHAHRNQELVGFRFL